ncbi:hypothetical protein NEUTE1DRAFT_17702, partial [Neurospora tetrasperma FGSC 2508]
MVQVVTPQLPSPSPISWPNSQDCQTYHHQPALTREAEESQKETFPRPTSPSQSSFVDIQNITEWDIHSWTCQYPGANSSEKSCEEKFHSWFKADSPSPSGTGLDQTGNALFNFVPRLVNRVENNIADLFPGISEPLQHGLAWLNNAHNAVLHAADVGGGELC